MQLFVHIITFLYSVGYINENVLLFLYDITMWKSKISTRSVISMLVDFYTYKSNHVRHLVILL